MERPALMKGNEAAAEAALRAGCTFYAGYPITPQTELLEYMATNLPRVGGRFIQSESELAAISMVYGASAAGLAGHDLLFQPGDQPDAGGALLPGLRRNCPR